MQLESVFAEQRKLQDAHVAQTQAKPNTMVLMLFGLGKERFAAPIDVVREVIDAVPIVPYPERKRWHLGVINLRGSIVPVVELRPDEYGGPRPRIIVFEDASGNPFGVGADEVWKSETTEDAHLGGSSMMRIDGALVRLLSRADLVSVTEDGHV
jgi:chemotaxis signal transduction protein